MSDYYLNKTDLTNLLVETHQLLKTHGFDGSFKREGEVPLRLLEAFKLAVGEFPNSKMFFLPPHKRELIICAYHLLEERMTQFHPPYTTMSAWLSEAATQEQVLSLIENVLQDYGVTP